MIERQIVLKEINDLILLSADDITEDVELLGSFIDRMKQKQIRVISILDRIQLHLELNYLCRYEKMLLMSSAVMNSRNYQPKNSVLRSQKEIKKKSRIAIYCRVSTREQAILGYSIENQKEKNLMYLELYDYDIECVEYYIDRGASAGNLNRKEMRRMLDDIEDGKIDEVIIYKLDRMSRSVLDIYEILQMFLSNNVNLVAVMDNLDIKTANGRMVLGILAIFAQWERETVIERTNDGLLQMAAEGKYPKSGCPLGYDKDTNKYLSVNEHDSSIVIKIFFLARSGYTFSEISIKIKEEYDILLKPFRIKAIIMEDGYFGEFEYKGYIFKDIMPAIIQQEDALEARKISGKRSQMYGKEQSKFYYRNKIKCNCCGELVGGIPTYKKDKRYYYYYCNKCNKRINQDKIIELTLSKMISKIDVDNASKNVKQVMKNIKGFETKIRNVTRKYTEDIVSEDAYTIMIAEIEKRLEKERAKLGETKIVKGMKWSELSDTEKRDLVEKTILNMAVDLEKKVIVKVDYVV